MQTLYITPLQN